MTQFDLFSEQPPRVNADALMAALDGINRSGKGKVWFAGQGDRDSSSQMKCEMLSPRYTTRLKDIPGIKISFVHFHCRQNHISVMTTTKATP